MPRSPGFLLALSLALPLAAFGCGRGARDLVAARDGAEPTPPALRIRAQLTAQGADRFTGRFEFAGIAGAPAGPVLYALDPPAQGDTTWQSAPAGPLSLTLARRPGRPYVLVVKSLTARGVASPTERIAFTADDVIAAATIVSPRPTREVAISTPTAFEVRWTGTDPEAPGGVPTGYLTRLVLATDIDPANPTGITLAALQAYLANDLATNRAAWTQTADTAQALSNLTPNTLCYFAVAALDAGGAPGATETTFDLDRNVLWFRATLDQQIGPTLTVFDALFSSTKHVISLDPTPQITVPVRAGQPIAFNWVAQPPVGLTIGGYRWALDLADLADESPRRNANDLAHWSAWSPSDLSATVGPFPAGDANKPDHRMCIEARDQFGRTNLFVVAIDVLGKPRPTRDLLVVDDLYGQPTQLRADGSVILNSAYPTEAEQDSFYFAVGGFPDSLLLRSGKPGAVSVPGAFAGFDYDTLDYRFWPEEGISVLGRYRAVAWYTDQFSAANSGAKFGSSRPITALRFVNMLGQLNTLAAYVQEGGKAWLFGDGATTAIGNGYYSRIRLGGLPTLPYTSGDDPRTDILVPGDFLYDYGHLRSELNVPDRALSTTVQQALKACLPYLPEFAGPASNADRTHDPRVGPGAARTALRWSGLPRLTLAAYRGANAYPDLRALHQTWEIPSPLWVTEPKGAGDVPVLDTLYLYQASAYDPNDALLPPADGYPNAVAYHGSEHGEVVWFGFPLYVFEPDQARQVVQVVLREFGISPLPPGVRQGPGAAEPPDAALTEAIPVGRRSP